MAKCSFCNREVDSLKTAIKGGELISERCDRCIANFQTGAIYARRNEREWQKREFYKDTLQRYDGDKPSEEFIRAYPDVAANQWGEEVLRDYGVKKKLL